MNGASKQGIPSDHSFIVPLDRPVQLVDDLSSSVTLTGDELLWNVVIGCTGASGVCKECSAKAYTEHWLTKTGYYNDAESWRNVLSYMYAVTEEPKRWPSKEPRNILVAPAGDLFHDLVADSFIDRVLSVIHRSPQHTFYILTKNAARMSRYFAARAKNNFDPATRRDPELRGLHWPLPNVWVGISCETQRSYMSRVTYLIQTPAVRRFIVIEPMLEPIRLEQVPLETRDILWPLLGVIQAYLGQDAGGRYSWDPIDQPLAVVNKIDWVILAGYRGSAMRPMHPMWALAIQKSCQRAGVPFYFKGWGDYIPTRMPELDSDESLIIMSRDGTCRGKGAGSKTNHLFVDPATADFHMTRKTARHLHDMLGSSQCKERPAPTPPHRVRLVDQSVKARQLKRMSDTQTAIAALADIPPPNPPTLPSTPVEQVEASPMTFMERAMKTAIRITARVQGTGSNKESAKPDQRPNPLGQKKPGIKV